MEVLNNIKETVLKSGMNEAGYIKISDLVFHDEVRKICEGNTCRNYGTNWACPPAVGTIEECKKRVEQYSHMLLFSKKYDLEDSFDLEGMIEAGRQFKADVCSIEENVSSLCSEYMILSNEGCDRCEKCTYPDEPCRSMKTLHHSLEGYGVIVSHMAKSAGIKYINGEDTVTYFGALLFNIKG